MKSSSKQTVSSSADSQQHGMQDERQEAAFIASEERGKNRIHKRIDKLSKSQSELSTKVGSMMSEIAVALEDKAKAVAELDDATASIDTKIKTLETGLDKKVLEARNKIIEPLAIFVGLFTFISIGFQIFTQVKEYILWMPILGAVLGGIIIFAGLIIHASSVSVDTAKRRKYTFGIIALGAAIFISAGVYYHMAVEVLRAEDAKQCVIVKPLIETAEQETYCKLSR